MPTAAPSVLEAWAFPNELAADLAQWTPQAGLVPVLDELRPACLSADGRIDAVVAVERHIAMLQARSSELLAAIDAGDTTEDGWARDSVAAALRVPPASMKSRMSDARDLAERLPATLESLRAGEITHRHAVALVDATRSLPLDKAATVEAAVLGRAGELTVTQFRALVKREVLRVSDPADEAEAHADAVADRRVIFTPTENGMTELWAYLSAEGAAAIKATLDAMAHKTIHQPGGDDRTADHRRPTSRRRPRRPRPHQARRRVAVPPRPHRTLTDEPATDEADTDSAGTDSAGTDSAGTDSDCSGPTGNGTELAYGHGQRPAVQVTIAASTLMGLDDQPCELDGYGAITAAMARRIATDPTTEENTTSLCRRHHRLKHSGLWQLDRDDATGTTIWTNHARRTYTSQPPDLPTTTGAMPHSGPTTTSRTAQLATASDTAPPPF